MTEIGMDGHAIEESLRYNRPQTVAEEQYLLDAVQKTLRALGDVTDACHKRSLTTSHASELGILAMFFDAMAVRLVVARIAASIYELLWVCQSSSPLRHLSRRMPYHQERLGDLCGARLVRCLRSIGSKPGADAAAVAYEKKGKEK